MYEYIKRLYLSGKLTDVGLDAAVMRGWVTTEQHNALVEEKGAASE